MMKIALFLTLACSAFANNLKVVKHKDLKTFSLNGNSITSVANPMLGSNTFEVWRTQWSPGCCTPPHTHETEEIFVFLKGKGKVIIDDQEMHFKAPCTIICPAHKQHQFFNTGDEETDSIVVLGAHSEIVDANETIMNLPWR